ncbi:hypothetical protein AKA01nite_17980 [Alkalibacterium kapii]|uniref:Uncharacterized protein n=1 Tax=Alkalibacterium kapii TaxID=426704 RepID=A0A511AVJ5_9LACT|nr:hypothetical protein AKA01nite_17980 [Alkalibacterium kapii]
MFYIKFHPKKVEVRLQVSMIKRESNEDVKVRLIQSVIKILAAEEGGGSAPTKFNRA